jgi:hypothetical protein
MFSYPRYIGFSSLTSSHHSNAPMKTILLSVILVILWSATLLAQDSVDTRPLSEARSFPTTSREISLSVEGPSVSRSVDLSLATIPIPLPVVDFSFDLEGPIDVTAITEEDTIQPPPRRKLLPDKLSFVERGLWDETGLMRKIGIAGPLTPESRKRELTARRTMLTIHQIGGFVTLGLMTSAVYCGQQLLNGRRQFRNLHQGLVVGTIASYSVTGLLAALSPPPLIRRDEVSTTTIHKTLAWVHFVGMVVTPILGATLHHTHTLNYDQTARFHQVSAYITTAALAASLVVITF